MSGPFYALIIPLSEGSPSHPIAPGGGQPSHPIYNPPGIWGGGGVGPYPDQGLPGPQPGGGQPSHPIYNPPYPSQGPGFPTHPIAPGGSPPGTWGGSGQPFPTNPIVLPPIEPGGPPVVIWGPINTPDQSLPGPGGRPSHPIINPPLPPPPEEGGKPPPDEGGWGYHPEYGWGYFPAGTPEPKKPA